VSRTKRRHEIKEELELLKKVRPLAAGGEAMHNRMRKTPVKVLVKLIYPSGMCTVIYPDGSSRLVRTGALSAL
jgi:hypothetical protein